MPKTTKEDLTGIRYGKLIALHFEPDESKFAKWVCQCDCGNTKKFFASSIKRGLSRSCGCSSGAMRAESSTKHGHAKREIGHSPTYSSWVNMIDRGLRHQNPNSQRYKERGITVYEKWHDFSEFLADMGERPEGHSIGRIDNDLGYYPANCRWESRRQQSLNTTRTIWIIYEGVRVTLFEFCEQNNISRKAVKARAFRRGKDYVAALASMGIQCQPG